LNLPFFVTLQTVFDLKRSAERILENITQRETSRPALHTKYDSSNKTKRMRCAGHPARMGGEMYTKFWDGGNLKEKDHFGKVRADGKIVPMNLSSLMTRTVRSLKTGHRRF
jgi:hypothetical protein